MKINKYLLKITELVMKLSIYKFLCTLRTIFLKLLVVLVHCTCGARILVFG